MFQHVNSFTYMQTMQVYHSLVPPPITLHLWSNRVPEKSIFTSQWFLIMQHLGFLFFLSSLGAFNCLAASIGEWLRRKGCSNLESRVFHTNSSTLIWTSLVTFFSLQQAIGLDINWKSLCMLNHSNCFILLITNETILFNGHSSNHTDSVF